LEEEGAKLKPNVERELRMYMTAFLETEEKITSFVKAKGLLVFANSTPTPPQPENSSSL